MKKITTYIVAAVLCLFFKVNAGEVDGSRGTFLRALAVEDFVVSGKVTDERGVGLVGASVQLKGTAKVVRTGLDGGFSIVVPSEGSVLVFTFLGFEGAERVVGSRREFLVVLSEARELMNVVEVNAGYYSVSKKLLTGSIGSVRSAEIERQPVTSPLQALQGRVTGAYISQQNGTPGANINVQIRGRNGIETSGNPFYVVDGVPFGSVGLTSSLSVSTRVFGSQGASPLNMISPDDIQSIEILKDADATAIYGSRGANGVVLITTKKGKSGKTSIDFSSYYGVSKVTRFLPMLKTADYLALRRAAFALDGVAPAASDHDVNGTWDEHGYTDWQKELLGGSAEMSSSKIAVSGGNELNSFLLSGTYQSQGTVYKGDLGYGRASVHLAGSHSSKDKAFSASFSATYSRDRTNWLNNDFVPRALTLPPNAPLLYNGDGSLNWANSSWINPLRELEAKYNAVNGNLIASSVLSYKLLDELELKANLGYSSQSLVDHTFQGLSYNDPAENKTPANSIADYNDTKGGSWSIEPQVNYGKQTRFGNFSLLVGMSFQNQFRDQLLLRGIGFASDALMGSARSAGNLQARAYVNSVYRYTGVYGRVNYNLSDKYVINLTGRRDGSSRFGPGRQFANFGAVGLAYIFSKEEFIRKNLPFISFGKLRASYGSSGNDQIGDYEYLDSYQSTGGYNGIAGLSPLRLYNPDFAWEMNRKLEVALDFGLLKDRIRGTVGYYRNRSSNQLINYPLSSVTGFTSVRANMGAVIQNSGLELELTTENFHSKDFSWTSSLNFTAPSNKLVSFPGIENTSYNTSYTVGRSINSAKVYHLLGVDSQTGIYVFQDYNADGQLTAAADMQLVKDRGQRYFGGVANNLRFKSLELDFLFQFVGQSAGNIRALLPGSPGAINNVPQAYLGELWLAPGEHRPMMRPTAANSDALAAYSRYTFSDAAISDASFVRLKNVSLSFKTQKVLPGRNLRIFVQGQNLWTVTKYLGLDPETANYSLPPLRSYTLGLQLIL